MAVRNCSLRIWNFWLSSWRPRNVSKKSFRSLSKFREKPLGSSWYIKHFHRRGRGYIPPLYGQKLNYLLSQCFHYALVMQSIIKTAKMKLKKIVNKPTPLLEHTLTRFLSKIPLYNCLFLNPEPKYIRKHIKSAIKFHFNLTKLHN